LGSHLFRLYDLFHLGRSRRGRKLQMLGMNYGMTRYSDYFILLVAGLVSTSIILYIIMINFLLVCILLSLPIPHSDISSIDIKVFGGFS